MVSHQGSKLPLYPKWFPSGVSAECIYIEAQNEWSPFSPYETRKWIPAAFIYLRFSTIMCENRNVYVNKRGQLKCFILRTCKLCKIACKLCGTMKKGKKAQHAITGHVLCYHNRMYFHSGLHTFTFNMLPRKPPLLFEWKSEKRISVERCSRVRASSPIQP